MAVLKTSYDGGVTWVPVQAGIPGPPGEKGDKGDPGVGINLMGSKPTVGDLPASNNTQGDTWLVEADGHLWVWDDGAWVDGGNVQGPPGEITLAQGDARYVKQAGGSFTGPVDTTSSLTFKSPGNVFAATAAFLSTQFTFSLVPGSATGDLRETHRWSYDATNNKWTVNSAGFEAATIATTGIAAFGGKATSAATATSDTATTLTTKGYVDSRVVVVAAKPGSAAGYTEGTLILVAP